MRDYTATAAAPTNSTEVTAAQRALLRFLQREGHLGSDDVVRLEHMAQSEKLAVTEVLERQGVITEKDLAVLLATALRLRLIDLTTCPLDPHLSRELKEAVATRYQVVPVRAEAGSIEVATANPLDLDALKAVEFATGKRVKALVTTRVEVTDALAHVYRLQESLDQFLQHVPEEETLTLTELHDQGGDLRTMAQEAELPPVIKLADLILIEGIKTRASDVHIEPGNDAVAVRLRVDGILEESFRLPKWVQSALTGRLKVMAKLDITERRVPQDGRIQVRYQGRLVDLRVSSLPAKHGEKITLRILDGGAAMNALDRVGLSAADLQRLRDAVRKPEGMILVTGPTGSGKTTTLYALLREKLSPGINIVTIENPIEYQLKGINQVEVNEKQGLTFAGVLRSVLRQDPDVILVGEIRDKETAQIALQAAQTGHLVLTTVHTNDAAAAVTRLHDLGVEPYVIASAVNLIVAQRLVRRVCQSCSVPYEPSEESRRLLHFDDESIQARRGAGCSACRQSGFAGRVGIYETLAISPAITRLIESGATETAIRHQARAEGCRALLDDAREKLAAGLTVVDEVLRVVQIDDDAPCCPGCRREVAEDHAVCPHCGTALRASCAGCAKTLSPEWTTCPYCGAKAGRTDDRPASSAGGDRSEAGTTAAPASEAPPRRTYKALVADDSATVRELVRAALDRSALGLSVVTASNGHEALALVAIERPDIVILDLEMPELDGFEVCRRLRSDVRTAFIPILMLTVQSSEESIARGFDAGTDDYIAKPFRRDDLVARVGRALERTYGRDAVASPQDGMTAIPAPQAGSQAALDDLQAAIAQLRTAQASAAAAIDEMRAEHRRSVAEIHDLAEMLHRHLGADTPSATAELLSTWRRRFSGA